MKLQLVARSERTPQSAFMERYEWLLNLAVKLTHGERSEAEDILHDAYVQFQRVATRLDSIENVDAYLHRTVRNLHLSRVMKRSRNPLVELDSFEYDTLEVSVEAVDPFRLATIQSELFAVCEWACSRRIETRAASILLLRFFLRYLPSEIAMLCRCNRQAVEKSLQLARRELRQVLKAEPAVSSTDKPFVHEMNVPRRSDEVQQLYREDHLNLVLFQRIFSERIGECISSDDLQELYIGEDQPGRMVLAHLTSCRDCLERVNRHLHLRSIVERDDEDGPLGGIGGGTDRKKSPRPASSPGAFLQRAERTVSMLFEHRPQRLSVHLDGERKASLALQGIENEFTIEAGRSRQLNFVEVFSEQGLLLAYLPITPLNEGGDFAQSIRVPFSEGRELCVELCFTQPRPRIALSYHDPLMLELKDPSRSFSNLSELPVADVQAKALDLLAEWWRQTRSVARLPFQTMPRALVTLMAIALVVLLPVLQIKQSTLSAETLLVRAENWQASAAAGQVLHRTFHYEERNIKGASTVKQRRIEIWRQKNGRSLRRMYDQNGRVTASATGNVRDKMNLESAWQFEPSPDAFRSLTADSKVTAEEQSGRYVVRSSSNELDLDKASYRPTKMVIQVGEASVAMTEVATESLPLSKTPLAENPVAEAGEARREALSAPANLELSEMMVRSRLHELKADLGEDVHVERSHDGVIVSGVVAPESRRAELMTGLKELPNVKLALRSPEEVSRLEKVHRVIDRSAEPNAAPLLQDWMQSRYVGEDERSAFVSRALDQVDQCMWHSRALVSLVQRYGGLDDPTVHAIVSDHLSRLNEEIGSIQHWMADLPGPPVPPLVFQIPTTTAGKVQLMLQTSRQLDDDLAELLTAHTLPPGSEEQNAQNILRTCRQRLQLLNELTRQLR